MNNYGPNTDVSFSFGKNWKEFLRHSLSKERLRIAEETTRRLLALDELGGMTFMDIGCGSGIFSYVAHRMGATQVISVDVDPYSVQCCNQMRAYAGDPENWSVLQGSILDDEFVRSLPRSDVVYSWGVLHHTGSMWHAINNAASLLKPGGRLAIAVYNKLEYNTLKSWRGSHKWLRIKRAYNRSNSLTKRLMEVTLAAKDISLMLMRFRNPVTEIRSYNANRGMSWWYDIIDWLGGYPYEFASAGEIFTFCHEEFGMQLERLNSTSSLGCHEFLFMLPRSGSDAQ